MGRPTCVRCGYDLTGIGRNQRWAACPECGHVFDPTDPAPRPWPRPPVLGLLLFGPPTAIVAGAAAMTWLDEAMSLGGVLRQLSVVLLIAAIATPLVVCDRLAGAHSVRHERRLLWLVLSVVSVAYAMVLMLVTLVFFMR